MAPSSVSKAYLRLEIDQLVGADGLEVGAERQHFADDRALHLAADDRNDAANADAGLAGGDDVADFVR